MFNYQPTPDYYNDYISHNIIGLGLELYDKHKTATDKNYAKKKTDQRKKINDKIKKYLTNGAKKAHKYVYKYLNKKGKVIYVYNTNGQARIKRMHNV